MMIYHDKIEKKEINPGVVFQYLFQGGKQLMGYHWNMADGSKVEMHTHESEQLGYCIKGGFIIVEDGRQRISDWRGRRLYYSGECAAFFRGGWRY